MLRSSSVAALSLLFVVACDSAESAKNKAVDAADKAADAADKTEKFAKDAAKTTKDAVDSSKHALKVGADTAKSTADKAKKLWGDVPYSGELSATASKWISEATDDSSIAKMISTGKQVAPVALEIGSTLGKALDNDSMVEPIFQNIEDGNTAEVDKAIGDMPHTEVIDGLTVGFKQIDETSNDTVSKERGYLVTWREGDHLVGFVYRSKRTIDVKTLAAEAPRLIALTKTVLEGL